MNIGMAMVVKFTFWVHVPIAMVAKATKKELNRAIGLALIDTRRQLNNQPPMGAATTWPTADTARIMPPAPKPNPVARTRK